MQERGGDSHALGPREEMSARSVSLVVFIKFVEAVPWLSGTGGAGHVRLPVVVSDLAYAALSRKAKVEPTTTRKTQKS